MSINNVQLEAFIAEYKYDPHYEIVWWMVAGLLKGEILEKFFMLFEGAPRDLLGGRHQQVIMGCLNEAREQLNQQTVQRIEAELMQYFCFEMALDQTSFLSIALGSSGAFPEHLLLQGLTQFEDKKWKIIQTLGHRPFLSEEAYAALVAIFIASVSAGKDWMVMNAAADVLKYALPESAQMALVTILQSHNTSVELKCFAINLLGQQKIFLQSIGTALVCALKDKNATLRCAAVVALNRWGISYVLVFALQDTDAKVRQTARDLLCQETSLSEDTQKDLINALQDDSPNALCKCAVIDILGKQNTLIEYAYIALIAVIKDKKIRIRGVQL